MKRVIFESIIFVSIISVLGYFVLSFFIGWFFRDTLPIIKKAVCFVTESFASKTFLMFKLFLMRKNLNKNRKN